MKTAFILAFLFLASTGCAGGKLTEPTLPLTEAQLQVATTQPNPSLREVQNVRKLSEQELALINSLLANSTRRSLAYVTCEYYIQFASADGPRRIGLVYNSNNEMPGFDVSPPDALTYWTTGFHNVLEPRDKALAAEFLKSLQK